MSCGAVIEQPFRTEVFSQVVVLDYNVFDEFRRKFRIQSSGRAGENNPPGLGFTWLIIKAAIPENFIGGAVPNGNSSAVFNLITLVAYKMP